MPISFLPATKDEDGAWRYTIMVLEANGKPPRLIVGPPDGDFRGMLEPEFRKMLAEQFGLPLADVEKGVQFAMRGQETDSERH